MRGTTAHRRDIDGLRAVAILPVLLYHANVWPFSAGYVGVDIFFVLSGYLITGLILRAQDGAGFSLVDFYDRRVRRILPALGVVLVAVTVASLFILLPDELQDFGRSLGFAVLFCANIFDWIVQTNYFGVYADQTPLLHVWSLSVEEQFYVFWPLLLLALRGRRHVLLWVIAGLAGASLVLALALAATDPIFTFYLLPTRAWQLLVGAFLAAGSLGPIRHVVVRNAMALAGMVLVAIGVFAPFHEPAWHSIAAAFGAAAILFAADGGDNFASSLLATRLPVFVGQISYSLYLWHWPLLVFARLVADRPLGVAEAVLVLSAAFVLAVLSWKFVEQPARRRSGVVTRLWPVSFRVAAVGSGALFAIAAALYFGRGLPARVDPNVQALGAEARIASKVRWCGVVDNCVTGSAAWRDEIVLWGDSHARALLPGVQPLAAGRHARLRVFTHPGCRPLLGVPTIDNVRACARFNTEAERMIRSIPHLRMVILEARWEFEERQFRNGDPREARALMETSLDRLVGELTGRGIPVLLVGNFPLFPDSPVHCMGRERMFGRDPSRCSILSADANAAITGPTDRLVAAVAARHPLSRAFLPSTALCDRVSCHALLAGHLLYVDEHHLSPAGAALVGQRLDAALGNWPR